LAVNSGSSSIKLAVFPPDHEGRPEARGRVDDIGSGSSSIRFENGEGVALLEKRVALAGHEDALAELAAWLGSNYGPRAFGGVGYRVVHGGERFDEPQLVSPGLLDEIERLAPFASQHLPAQLADMRLLGRLYPEATHVACFDTSFHRTMPRIAQRYPLPDWAEREGIVRYGFHGLSYEYIVSVLASERPGMPRRAVVAHLGNGASMVALAGGRSVETTMGFTPTGGLMMSTRSGDLDPGVLLYLLEEKGLRVAEVAALVKQRSGLLGVSGLSSDMQVLLETESADERAAEAVELFCYLAKKFLGGLVSVLGGLDTLVFTGGIGENAAPVRARICTGLGFLGVVFDEAANERDETLISPADSRVQVRVIKTNEELTIARHTGRMIMRLRGDSDEQRLRTA